MSAESARPQVKQASAESSFKALQEGQIISVTLLPPDCVPEWPVAASPPPPGVRWTIPMALQSVNPTDGSLLREYPETTPAEVATALAAAPRAFESWRRAPFAERAAVLGRAGALLRERRDALSRLMALEMGKPLAQGRAEADKCAWVCEHYAEHAERLLAPEDAPTDASRSYVAFEPLGPVLAVMPWNFPLWQVFRFAAPALMAGNVGLLKHASNVSGCALAIEGILHEAGLPRDAFRALLVGSARVAALVEDPGGRGGHADRQHAGGPGRRREGGRLPQEDRPGAGRQRPVRGPRGRGRRGGRRDLRRRAAGQRRAELHRRQALHRGGGGAPTVPGAPRGAGEGPPDGRPARGGNDVGPQARRDLRDELHRQVEASVARGARALLGCRVPGGPGAFYPPSVLAGVAPGMPAFDEELFGPVAAIVAARDERDAIRLANQTVYGLGAAVFTRDVERGERIARHELAAGSCFVNAFVRSDPRLPFGGIRESGYGRELGAFGIREFVNVKTVYVA